MKQFFDLVTDSNPEAEWRLIQLERAYFGLPNAINQRVVSLIELLRDRKGDPEARADIVSQVNQLLRGGGLCFRFDDGRTSSSLRFNFAAAGGRRRIPVQFDLDVRKGYGNTDTRGLKHQYNIVPRLKVASTEDGE